MMDSDDLENPEISYDNPEIAYYDNGQKHYETWFDGDYLDYHRIDGPANQRWYENGQKNWEEWIVNGNFHRVGGPAIQYWRRNGQKYSEQWWINGIIYDTIQEYAKALVKLGFMTKATAMYLLLTWR